MLCASSVAARQGAAQTPSAPFAVVPKPPQIKATAAILVDAVSGQVIYSKNADLQLPPASTTKIMTAILLLENTKPEDVITASKWVSETEGSSLHLKPGEKITAHDLLFALMLRSANDGCVACAEHVCGSESKFAEMMTQKAKEIGATRTVFHNSNGLNENPNLTTARDLSTMARYASQYPAFNEATSTRFYTIKRSSDSKDVVLRNHAKFLWKFPGADGIKTGYTVPAGHCFVGAATWNGWRLISVVLHSPDVVTETAQLLKYGFQSFQAHSLAQAGKIYADVPVMQGQEETVPAEAQRDLRIVLPKDKQPNVELKPRFESVHAPVAAGSVVGTLEAWSNGKVVASTPLVAGHTVERTMLAAATHSAGGLYLLGAAGMATVFYAATIAKTARRRGYRLAALLRGSHRRG